jgi:uracil permease
MVLLFGTIAGIGLKTMLDAKVDLMEPRNLVIVAVVLTCGIGGLTLKFGAFALTGVGLVSLFAILLNLILPEKAASHQGIEEGQDV